MLLIDTSYFVNEISLPSVKSTSETVGSDKVIANSKNNSLNAFIEEYQEKFLHLLFGKSFTDEFLEGLNNEVYLKDNKNNFIKEISGKFIKIKTNNNKKWLVLKSKLCVEKIFYKESPIAYYVYFYYLQNLRDNTTVTGKKKHNSSFANNVSDYKSIVRAWYKMIEFNRMFINWFNNNSEIYNFKLYTEPVFNPSENSHFVCKDLLTPINTI